MKQFDEFLKQHNSATKLIITVIVILTIGDPLIINWMFEMPALWGFFAVEWEAVDALSYYGDVLSFLGTVVLSGMALWQNLVIKEAEDKHTRLLEQMEKEKNAPYLIIDNVVSSGNAKKISFAVKNLTDNIAQDVTVINARIENSDGTVCWAEDKTYSTPYVDSKKEFKIEIITCGVTDQTQRILFEVEMYDIFGEIHRYTAVGSFLKHKNLPTFVMKRK